MVRKPSEQGQFQGGDGKAGVPEEMNIFSGIASSRVGEESVASAGGPLLLSSSRSEDHGARASMSSCMVAAAKYHFKNVPYDGFSLLSFVVAARRSD